MFTRTLIATALVFSAPAFAVAQDGRSEQIEYGAGDLADERARRSLVADIHAAARRVCDVRGSRDLATLRAERRCSRVAVGQAMLQLDRQYADASQSAGSIEVSAG